jgi:N-acetylmuramoyl-L-alanine amidase
MTRNGMEDVGLWPRVALADSLDADILVSIHNNAFPDGVNPFTNNGTTTFFNHPQSLALARAVQSRLVPRTGLRNLGVVRGDLALARPTWYPAILTEGFYLMVPEQEALLRTPAGQRRYAQGVVDGITAFLHDVASRSPQP